MIQIGLVRASILATVCAVFLPLGTGQTPTTTKHSKDLQGQQPSRRSTDRYFTRCIEELDLAACRRAKKLTLSAKEKSQVLTYEYAAQSSCESKTLLDEAIRLDPQNALAYFFRARCGPPNVEETVRSYLKAIELNPEWKRYYVDVAILAEWQSYNVEAAILANGANGHRSNQQALKLWELAIESAPDDPRVYAGYAAALKSLGKNAEAVATFRKGLAANPSDANAMYGLCSMYIDEKDPAKFRPLCTTAIDVLPGELLGELGFQLRLINELALAEAAYRKALERGHDPQHVSQLSLANTLLQEGKTAEAAEIYRQYLLKNPEDSTYIGAYASALESAGDLKKAEKEYLRAADHRDCGTLSNLGRFYLHQKRFQEAFEQFDQAFQEQWDCPTPVYLLTHEAQAFGPTQQEIPQFEKRILARAHPKPDEKTANTWYRFANLAHEFGQNEEAAAAYRRAADLSPKQAFPLGALGWALYDDGRYEEAITAFEEAEKREPGYLKSAPEVQRRYERAIEALKGKKP